ncbi:type VII secretion system-associated protein [Actinoallomurus sp. CA-150999]|uniref:type VII secretion system-associated protein n=1 Tax=Actinoallomurus sp. CA-150999 TaxID=3239887 RepID=UPI003D8BAEDA
MTTDNMPPIPDSIREAARLAPDHWLGMLDPAWTGEGEPPSWAMLGRWRSDPDGEIVEWRENEDYRPSPAALGWPEPADDVDAAVQLAATGYGPGEAVTEALAAAKEVAVFVTPTGDPVAATAPDGRTPVIPVFTSPVYLHAAGRLAFELMDLWELVDSLPEEHVLYLNPSAPVSTTVETGMLLEALEQAGTDADEVGDQEADAADGQEEDDEPPVRPATVGGGPAADES